MIANQHRVPRVWFVFFIISSILFFHNAVSSTAAERYCISMTTDHQHVISGVKRIVIPFKVINHDNNFEKGFRASVSPDNARVSVHKIGANASIDDGDIQIASYELWLENATAVDSAVEYLVSLQSLKDCDINPAQHRVTVYPAQLRNVRTVDALLENRLYVGDRIVIPVIPSSAGSLPDHSFTVRTIANSKDTLVSTTSPIRIDIECLGADLQKLQVAILWNYRPNGSKYSEAVTVYEREADKFKYNSPEIRISERRVDYHLGKSPSVVVSGIGVFPPKVACGRNGNSEDIVSDIALNRYQSCHFELQPEFKRTGRDEYRMELKLQPILTPLSLINSRRRSNGSIKYTGDNIEITIRSNLRKELLLNSNNSSSDVSESFYLSIPEFRYDLNSYQGELPSDWIMNFFQSIKDEVRVYAVTGDKLDSLRAQILKNPTWPIEPSTDIASDFQDVASEIRRVARRMVRDGISREEILKVLYNEYDISKEVEDYASGVISYEVSRQAFWSQPQSGFVKQGTALLITSSHKGEGPARVHAFVQINDYRKSDPRSILAAASRDDYVLPAALAKIPTLTMNGQKSSTILQYLTTLVNGDVLQDVTNAVD